MREGRRGIGWGGCSRPKISCRSSRCERRRCRAPGTGHGRCPAGRLLGSRRDCRAVQKENAQNPHPVGMILAGERRCRLPKGGDDVIREYSSCIAIVLPVMASRPIWHPSDQPGDEVPEPPDACGEDISRVSAVSGGNGKRAVICHSKQRPGRQKTTGTLCDA